MFLLPRIFGEKPYLRYYCTRILYAGSKDLLENGIINLWLKRSTSNASNISQTVQCFHDPTLLRYLMFVIPSSPAFSQSLVIVDAIHFIRSWPWSCRSCCYSCSCRVSGYDAIGPFITFIAMSIEGVVVLLCCVIFDVESSTSTILTFQ